MPHRRSEKRTERLIRQFYKYLTLKKGLGEETAYEKRKIGKEQLEDILEACASPQRYLRRFETYFELDPESVTWDEDFEEWSMRYEDEIEEDYEQPYKVNEEINRSFSDEDLNASKATILNDLQTFLNYISANNGMKLTDANGFIVRKHVLALNAVMSCPKELKSTTNQTDSRTIHLLYNLSRTLGLFAVSTKNTLEVTPRIDIFRLLPPKEHFVVLFDAMWNETRWEKFLAPYSGGRPEWAQARRGDMAFLFSKCEL
jgi:hypothetical protein